MCMFCLMTLIGWMPNEILEVLKIIRNTANFPFVKFIVACDRTYIVNQLKSKGVEPKYLEKIFMIDFHFTASLCRLS